MAKLVAKLTSAVAKMLNGRSTKASQPPLEGLTQIGDIRIDHFIASNDAHALYYATREIEGVKQYLSVLISKPDADFIATTHWGPPTHDRENTVRTGQPRSFSLIDQNWQLPPQQVWQTLKPLLQNLLSQDPATIESHHRWFTLAKLHFVPGAGLLVAQNGQSNQRYDDQMSDRRHVYLSEALQNCCRSSDPLAYLLFQLGATFIYLLNDFLLPEDVHHRFGPWRPWTENIIATLFSNDQPPPNLDQIVQICEAELAKGGSTNLSQALKQSLHSPLDALNWWLPAAACLAEKHKQGKYYGHLEPKSILFFVDRVEFQMSETDCQENAKADLYSISLILAALLTNPQDRTRLYLKDWSAMHPLLQILLLPQLAGHSNQAQTVEALIADVKSKFLYYYLQTVTQDPYWMSNFEAA